MSKRVTVIIDSKEVQVEDSAILGHILHEVLNAQIRMSSKARQPRGLFCGMGICFDCLVTVDGRPGVRACMAHVRDGMRVETTS